MNGPVRYLFRYIQRTFFLSVSLFYAEGIAVLRKLRESVVASAINC